MFIYEKDEFRFYLQCRRNGLKLSRAKVAEMANINESTIYRVEMGLTAVTLDLLYALSKPLKVDLIKEISNFQFQQLDEYNKLINKIEWLLNSHDFNMLREPLNNLYLISQKIENDYYKAYISRYCKYIEACYINKCDVNNSDRSLSILLDLLKLSMKDLKNEYLEKLEISSSLDLRILMAIGIYFKNNKKYSLSELILERCYYSEISDISIFPMICNNLANVYHILDKQNLVLKVANKGIKHCCYNNIHESLYLLYYRKGTAKYYLGHKDYKKYFVQALCICNIFGYSTAMQKLTTYMKNNYNFKPTKLEKLSMIDDITSHNL